MNAPVEAGLAPFVDVRVAGEVCTLTLDRGDRYNPLSLAMVDALSAGLDAAGADPSVRVVVIAANGKGFSAGHDLKEIGAHRDAGWQRMLFDRCNAMMLKLTQLPQPTIARVHGIATAAGCQLVSMCDLAVASDNATFALPGLNTAVFCTHARRRRRAQRRAQARDGNAADGGADRRRHGARVGARQPRRRAGGARRRRSTRWRRRSSHAARRRSRSASVRSTPRSTKTWTARTRWPATRW